MSALPPPDAPAIRDVCLGPGDYHFGGGPTRIHTILGSCVAITVWHPQLKIGGMCHFMLPRRQPRSGSGKEMSEQEKNSTAGRYGDEAVAILLQEMQRARTRPAEYVAMIFGGGQMFDLTADCCDVGRRNLQAAVDLCRGSGLQVAVQQSGGRGHLSLFFELWTGHVYCKSNQALGVNS